MIELRAGSAQERDASGWTEGEMLVAESQGERAAWAIARRVARAPDEWELLYLETSQPWRRRGVGEKLLRALLHARPGIWFLEVRASNAAAIALYQKLGFQESGRRRDYYPALTGTEREEGIVFTLRTC
jgi:ribosomal-protein-alanine N-acetyltransferase